MVACRGRSGPIWAPRSPTKVSRILLLAAPRKLFIFSPKTHRFFILISKLFQPLRTIFQTPSPHEKWGWVPWRLQVWGVPSLSRKRQQHCTRYRSSGCHALLGPPAQLGISPVVPWFDRMAYGDGEDWRRFLQVVC